MWNVIVALAVGLIVTGTAQAQMGLAELKERLGAGNVPTGAGVGVAQVEALSNSSYAPDFNHSEFSGKTFTLKSGSSGVSPHATVVGRHDYGLSTSIAPGITSIFCYHASGWISGDFLRSGASVSTQPHPTPAGVKIFNNSWISNGGNDTLRRADFVITRDQALIVSGVNNTEPQYALMTNFFNGIAVGRSNGGHCTAASPNGLDGPGRMKPDIVAPGSTTSWATPMVSAAVALMVETARTYPLNNNPLAERTEVIKAVLLGGAKRNTTWTNNPATSGANRGVTSQPLDTAFGAGEVNVNYAHMMLTGGQRAAKTTPPAAAHVCQTGWDLPSVGPNQSRYWRFSLPVNSVTATVVATWHREVSPANMGAWTVADFDLRLWRVNTNGSLMTLVGNGGVPYFTAGNVVSQSSVDNIEMLYIHNLAAGDYVIEIKRKDTSGAAVPVAVSWMTDSAVQGADLNGDGQVSGFDLLMMLDSWGLCPGGIPGCPGDLDCSGHVNGHDLLTLLMQWGTNGTTSATYGNDFDDPSDLDYLNMIEEQHDGAATRN